MRPIGGYRRAFYWVFFEEARATNSSILKARALGRETHSTSYSREPGRPLAYLLGVDGSFETEGERSVCKADEGGRSSRGNRSEGRAKK
jgi:hypothetical protein